MTPPLATARDVSDADLLRAIRAWPARGDDPAAIVELRRKPWEYATSALLEFVTAVSDDGGEWHFVLKHLSPGRICAGARRAKPSFVLEPRREIEVYRRLLAPAHIGPSLVGSGMSPRTGIYWLLVEHVDGCRLFEVGDADIWTVAGRWLAALHDRLGERDSASLRRATRLIEYDRGWYMTWLQRALRFHSGAALRWLADRYDAVVDRLLLLPPTIIHGEFYPSNVLVGQKGGETVISPIDWEMTAIGPGIMDLAALTSGEWRERERRAVITAYAAASRSRGNGTIEDVVNSVDYARIHLAVQWLGWFGRRQAPSAHAHHWLADAIDRAEALRL